MSSVLQDIDHLTRRLYAHHDTQPSCHTIVNVEFPNSLDLALSIIGRFVVQQELFDCWNVV